MWTKSACVVLAWSILIILAVGMKESVRPVQANIRIASSTTEITLASTLSVGAAQVTAARPAARYVVQSGDTLSGIAARFAVRGGWPALYAANRPRIGPDPGLIYPGTVLVLPGNRTPTRYVVAVGDTLSSIATALAVRGGWPALYAANRPRIGPDPGLIRPGIVLAIPGRPAPAPPSSPASRPSPAPSRTGWPGGGHRPVPARPRPPSTGMPWWLTTILLAAGLVAAAAFAAGPLLAAWRRRRAATRAPQAAPTGAEPGPGPGGPGPGSGPTAAGKARLVVADYDRLVVTRSGQDGTVCVLRPPGAYPEAILRVARLVLPEDRYRQLARQLGMPASWPIVVADYDRLVVTCSTRDGTVYVLRPPGHDPAAILRAARLVLPEDPYQELADQLGVPASLPMG